MTSKFSGFHKPNLVGISSSIPTIPFVTYHLQEQFIKTKKKKKIIIIRLKKGCHQDILSLALFLFLQFYKNNRLNILLDNICSQKQVKNQ